MGPPMKKCGRRRRVIRAVFRWAEHGFAVVGVTFVIYGTCFNLSVVVSESMNPTLQGTSVATGDWVLAEKVTYWLRNPRRWEVALWRSGEGKQVMKRVVGLPGERVSLRKGRVLIDGTEAETPEAVASIKYLACGQLHRGRQASCGQGYFVLGDDSWDSQDSRFEGPMGPEQIGGRAWLIVWPWDRFGWVE